MDSFEIIEIEDHENKKNQDEECINKNKKVIYLKNRGWTSFIKLYSRGGDPFSTFNWVFRYQPIASAILHSYKRAESNLLAYKMGHHNLGQVGVWVIHLL